MPKKSLLRTLLFLVEKYAKKLSVIEVIFWNSAVIFSFFQFYSGIPEGLNNSLKVMDHFFNGPGSPFLIMSFFSNLSFIVFRLSVGVGVIYFSMIANNYTLSDYPNEIKYPDSRGAKISERSNSFSGPSVAVNDGMDMGHSIETTKYFLKFIERSRREVEAAKIKPVALIFVGAVISIIGIFFFVATIHSYESIRIENFLAEIPRLLMLLFIQVLAGFFLRQYRSSIEDLRYYEMNLRNRESQFLSFAISDQSGEKTTKDIIINDLLSQKDTMKLQNGETTVTIEVEKINSNEFSSLAEKIISFTSKFSERNNSEKHDK